jgi:hypothetical protein
MAVTFGRYEHLRIISDESNPRSRFSQVPHFMTLGVSRTSRPDPTRKNNIPAVSLQTRWDPKTQTLLTEAFNLKGSNLLGFRAMNSAGQVSWQFTPELDPALVERLRADMTTQSQKHITKAAATTLPQHLKNTDWQALRDKPKSAADFVNYWMWRIGRFSLIDTLSGTKRDYNDDPRDAYKNRPFKWL